MDLVTRRAEEALAGLHLEPRTVEAVSAAIAGSADPDGLLTRLPPILEASPGIAADPDLLARVVAVASVSRALSTALAANPGIVDEDRNDMSIGSRLRSIIFAAAGDDLIGKADLRASTARYSEDMDTLVAETLSTARADVSLRSPVAEELPFAVIAMGKWGASELNYYSDIDLVFVHDPLPTAEPESRSAAAALASRLLSLLSSPTFDGPSLRVDADLRPEGAMGPLSRSLDSYAAYYERWSESWELQALLKARFAAGEPALGKRFESLAATIIWDEGLDNEALRSMRTIKSQVEEGASPRDIKRARGGIRDVEFTVQILQLVHGRFDPDLRVRGTLDAIDALQAHGYIDEGDATALTKSYTFLRGIEHRIQLWDLQQSHELPTSPESLARIGRSLGYTQDPAAMLGEELARVRGEVRSLHERIYFRPILDALVGAPGPITREDAAIRLTALGFADVGAATAAVEDLTAGLSRRSRVMQQALPLMLDWLSQAPDPDLGLAQLRLLLANTVDHAPLVGLLHNNPLAGERLCLLLGTGRLLGDLIDRVPEFIARLASDEMIADIRELEGAQDRLMGLLESRPELDARIGTIRRFVRRRKLRIAARDVLADSPPWVTLAALSDSADAALTGGLHVVGGGDPGGFGIIAMGKWGGRELSYGSDVDLMYVYAEDGDRDRSLRLATELTRVISEPGRHGEAFELDPELRPEGRKGPLARSLEGFRRYYSEWSEPWELLALVKARPAVGDPAVLDRFSELIEPVVWRESLSEEVVREIRSIKARVEKERIPLDEDPDFHLKLGPGGLADVEFVTQLLQLRFGHEVPSLRLTGTFQALDALRSNDILESDDFNALHDSYLFCTRVRLRLHLQLGDKGDSLPRDPGALSHLAASLGFERSSELREQYRRHTRRARRSFERLFYG